MITKTMNIPDEFFNRYKTALPVCLTIPVDSETGEPLYTPAEWVIEDVKRLIKQRLVAIEHKAANINAQAAVTDTTENVSIT